MDPAVLDALSLRTNAELRYVSLIKLHKHNDNDTKPRSFYLCVGKHKLFFVNKKFDLSSIAPIELSHVDKVIEDSRGASDFVIMLGKDRPSELDEILYIECDQRSGLVDSLMIAISTDKMYTKSLVSAFPRYTHEMTKEKGKKPPALLPFIKYKSIEHGGYACFLLEKFEEQPNALSLCNTGCFADARDIKVQIEVSPPVPMTSLDKIGKSHVRFLAMDYKQKLTVGKLRYLLPVNTLYNKKMSPTDDPAQWTGWELHVIVEEDSGDREFFFCLLFRRSFIPPLLDCSQDVVVIFSYRQTVEKLNKIRVDPEQLNKANSLQRAMHRECRIAGDSLRVVGTVQEINRDIIKAKLDALKYGEDGYRYLQLQYGYVPKVNTLGREYIRSILRLLVQEDLLYNQELLEAPELKSCTSNMDPVDIRKEILNSAEGLEPVTATSVGVEVSETHTRTEGGVCEFMCVIRPTNTHTCEVSSANNMWEYRVSRYLSYCVDGGVLGTDFTLSTLCDAITNNKDSQNEIKLRDELMFLLHIRPLDLSKPHVKTPLLQAMSDASFTQTHTFNERVFAVFLEEDVLSKIDNRSASYMGDVLRVLLLSPNVTGGLKASVCRQALLEAQKASQRSPSSSEGGIDTTLFLRLIPPLLSIVRQGNSFLSTYALAALINISAASDSLKDQLASSGAAAVCVDQLASKEEDTTYYACVFLVNITRTASQRRLAVDAGVVGAVMDVLEANSNQVETKAKLLTQVSALIGQLSTDDHARTLLVCETDSLQLRHEAQLHLLSILQRAPRTPAYATLKAKVCFALRHLCRGCFRLKSVLGGPVLAVLLHDVTQFQSISPEFALQLVSLASSLADYRENSVILAQNQIEKKLEQLVAHAEVHMTSSLLSLRESATSLTAMVARHTKEEFFV
eukprot:GHVR01084523.1.p1 GENE.GHVR01084523.1~~GHVR01084523.1.p1  ORF type:complete len:907 (+),score=227.81 GHVR01084523.1:123-2843(+)